MDIDNAIKKYHLNFSYAENLKNQLQIIAEHLQLLIGKNVPQQRDLEPYEIIIAVDFYDLYNYIFPEERFAYSDTVFLDKKVQEQILTAECLFNNFFQISLILLPPYEIEMLNRLYLVKATADKLKNDLTSKTSEDIRELYNKLIENTEIKPILNKKNEHRDYKLSHGEKAKILKFIKRNYMDLFTLATFSYFDATESINKLLKTKKIIPLEKTNLGIAVDEDKIDRFATEIWLPKFNEIRKGDSWRYSNYIDALAFAYIIEINNKFKDQGKKRICLLLSSSLAVNNVARNSGKEYKISLDEWNFERSFVRDPKLLLTYLQFLVSKDDYETNLISILEAKKIIDDFLQKKTYVDDLKKNYNQNNDRVLNFLNWANKELEIINLQLADWQNLQFANKESAIYKQIEKCFLAKPILLYNEINKERDNRIQDILSLLNEDVIQKNEIPKEISRMVKSIKYSSTGIGVRKFLLLKRLFKTRTPFTTYMVDFNDLEIKKIYEKVIFEGITDGVIEKLIFKLEEVNPINIEAHLLYAYFLNKEKQQKEAEKVLCQIQRYIKTDYEKFQYLFIENMVLASQSKTIIKAIENCDVGIEMDPKNPRFQIQKGFFIWRAMSSNLPNLKYGRNDVYSCMQRAYEISNKQKCQKSLRVILSNLMFYYFEDQKYEESLSYYGKLMELKNDLPQEKVEGTVWYFADAIYSYIQSANSKDYKQLEHLKNAVINMVTAHNRFPHNFYKKILDKFNSELQKLTSNWPQV